MLLKVGVAVINAEPFYNFQLNCSDFANLKTFQPMKNCNKVYYKNYSKVMSLEQELGSFIELQKT